MFPMLFISTSSCIFEHGLEVYLLSSPHTDCTRVAHFHLASGGRVASTSHTPIPRIYCIWLQKKKKDVSIFNLR